MDPHQNMKNQDFNPIEQHVNLDQVTKSSALYLLKLQEDLSFTENNRQISSTEYKDNC